MAGSMLSRLDPRTRRLLGVGAATYLGRLGGALALLIYVPLAREMLDPERFGVWMMLSALLAFFAFADLGLGYALLNRVTAVQAGDPLLRRSELAGELASAYACTLVLGSVLLLGWCAWCLLAPDASAAVGQVTPAHRADVVAGLTAFVLLFALNLPAALIQKAQLGAQDGHWVGIAQFAASALTLAALPLALSWGGGLATLVASTLGVQLLVNLCSTLWWLGRQRCLASLRPSAVDLQRVRALVASGALFFGLQLAGALAFQSDAIVISQTLGPVAYGEFSVVQRLFLLVGAGLAAGISGLWPAFGDALVRGEVVWARQTLVRALWLTGAVGSLAVVLLVLSMDVLAVRWLQAAVLPATGLLVALALWTVVEALGNVCGACMNGANLLRVQLMLGATMALLAFAGKWWLTPLWGPVGAVMATLVTFVLVCVPGLILILRRLLWTAPKAERQS
jgi:O-antigen/teichoic acid export membrane protein